METVIFFVGIAVVNTVSIVLGVILINAYAAWKRRKVLEKAFEAVAVELEKEIEKAKANKSFIDIITDQIRYDLENGGTGKGLRDE